MSTEDVDRTERVRGIVNDILSGQADGEYRLAGHIHLYGVAQAAAMLALRRGLDSELATVAGMLHDISTYHTCDSTDHDWHSARMAREILTRLCCFAQTEIDLVCQSIAHHRRKDEVHAAFDEVLKDADVLQHHLYNVRFVPLEKENARLSALYRKLGLG